MNLPVLIQIQYSHMKTDPYTQYQTHLKAGGGREGVAELKRRAAIGMSILMEN